MEIFIIAALSADGFIAEKTDQTSTDWTSQEDKKFFRDKTKAAGVIVMGSQTYKTIGHPLPGRLNIVYTNHPSSIPPAPNLQTTNLPPKELIQKLRATGYKQLAICGGSSIYSLFLKSGVVTKLYLTYEPVFFGNGVKLTDQKLNLKLRLLKIHQLSSQTVVLEYKI